MTPRRYVWKILKMKKNWLSVILLLVLYQHMSLISGNEATTPRPDHANPRQRRLEEIEQNVPCNITSPEFRNEKTNKKQQCGNGFRVSVIGGCQSDTCIRRIQSCHVHCSDVRSKGLENLSPLIQDIGDSSVDKEYSDFMMRGNYRSGYTEINQEYYLALSSNNTHNLQIQFNKWFYVNKMSIEVQPGAKTDFKVSVKYPNYKELALNKRYTGSSNQINIYVVEPYRILFINAADIFVSMSAQSSVSIKVSVEGFFPGRWGKPTNWAYHENEGIHSAKRTFKCFADSALSKEISTQYCIGSAEEYDELDTAWDMETVSWGKCTSDHCGSYGLKYGSSNVCRFKSGAIANDNMCRGKLVMTRGCFSICNDVCSKVGFLEEPIDSFNSDSPVAAVYTEGTISFCSRSNQHLFIQKFNQHMVNLSFLVENFDYYEPIDMIWQPCKENPIRGPFYALDGNYTLSHNFSQLISDGDYNIEYKLKGCKFPKPFWKKGECNETCGNGTRIVKLVCGKKKESIELDDKYCMEKINKINFTESCDTNITCPSYNFTTWSEWDTAEFRCGNYSLSRNRSCINDTSGNQVNETYCMEMLNETIGNEDKQIILSNVSCYNYTAWSDWNITESKCGNYTIQRNRSCIYIANVSQVNEIFCIEELDDDIGNVETTLFQSNISCYNFTQWSDWLYPLMKCDDYIISRRRNCFEIKTGNEVDEMFCLEEIDTSFGIEEIKLIQSNDSCSNFWGECSKTCGNGRQFRERKCLYADSNKKECQNSSFIMESKLCNTHNCPVNGFWGEWDEWSPCSTSCGRDGMEERMRFYNKPLYNGTDARNQSSNDGIDYRGCNFIMECPGIKVGGLSCKEICGKKSLSCNPNMTNIFNDIQIFTDVTLNCLNSNSNDKKVYQNDYDPSYNTRSRSCQGYIGDGIIDCNATAPEDHVRVCRCDADDELMFGKWSRWSECSKTCGIGTRKRNRMNIPTGDDERDTVLVKADIGKCGNLCPERGVWGAWGPFSRCDVTCGKGTQLRYRYCDNPPPKHGGPDCIGDSVDIISCGDPLICPIQGKWSEWSDWSYCDKPCNEGLRKRYRSCDNPIPEFGGMPCLGNSTEEKKCDNSACIPVMVNLSLVFYEENYDPAMNDLNSPEAISFLNRLNAQLGKIYKNHPNFVKKGSQFFTVQLHSLGNATSKEEP